MSKKPDSTPAAKQPANKPLDHSLVPQPTPTAGGSYVVDKGKLIKQNEG